MTVRIAVLDGSLRPGNGNTARALSRVCDALGPRISVDRVPLALYGGTVREMAERLRSADAFLVGTGTYWGSWSSPLQRFFEVMTAHEATDVFVGKPASAVVTMDATGGAEVASRLVATLACWGCLVPPFGWMALSRVALELEATDRSATTDVWGWADLDVLGANLVTAAEEAAKVPHDAWRVWSVDATEPVDGVWPATGELPPAAPDFP
jgi:hypothetical protein